MILNKLVLRNFKIHENLEVEFDGNIIGLVGPNGSGKSNLLGALQFALGGEQPGFKREDLLRWGADGGHVSLHLSHEGVNCSITRSLSSATATFTHGDEEYKGVTKVNEAIAAHLSIDKDLLKQSVFARQAEIDAVLFDDPRERELAFQRLCGVGDAGKVHKLLGERLAPLQLPEGTEEELAALVTRRGELSARCTALASELASASAALPSEEEKQSTARMRSDASAALAAAGRIASGLKARTGHESRLSAYTAESSELRKPDRTEAEMTADRDALSSLLSEAEGYARAAAAVETARSALEALSEPCVTAAPFSAAEVEEACAAFTAARDEYMRVDSDVKLYTGLGSALSGADMTVCPVCDGEIKDPGIVERKLNDARTRLGLSSYSKAEAEYDRRRKTVEKHSRDADKAASDYATRRDMLTRSLSQADGQLAHRVRPDEDPATIRSMLALVERDLSAVRDYRVRSARLSAGIEECRRAIEAADAEIENAVWSMQNAAEFVEVYRSQGVAAVEAFARHALDECAQRQTRMQHAEVRASEIRGMLAGMKGPLDAMDEEIAQRRETLERMGARSAAVKVLSDVREWFHYRSGPRTLAVAVMERMVDGVNGFLDSLGAPFSVRTADDGLGFLCLFSDGRPMPSCNGVEARHLSGGQRMQLAIAFRLAGYCLFASRLGLLSLDEPTTYMDDANVSNFCALLPRLKDVARSMNLQIILATHAREVLSHMDTVVDLYKGK